jgi:hypothetical protein
LTLIDRNDVGTESTEHALLVTQHWVSDGVHAIIVECAECTQRTFVGYGPTGPEAERAARIGHDDWVHAGSPPGAPQGVERLYRRLGFSAGRPQRRQADS